VDGLEVEKHSVIMLVDDSWDDLELMRLAFRKAGIRNPIAEMHSGEQAFAYLSGENGFADRRRFPLPCVIITDLKMPGMDGFDLLEWVKGFPAFEGVPKIVLTSSSDKGDERRARELGCAAYLVKPGEINDLVRLVVGMNEDWFSKHCPVQPE
jgi:CheY-like chemotaxis protein